VKETPQHVGYIDYASGYCVCCTSDGTVPGLTENTLTAAFFSFWHNTSQAVFGLMEWAPYVSMNLIKNYY